MCPKYFLTVSSGGDCFILQYVIARISMLKITLRIHVYIFLFISQFRISIITPTQKIQNDRNKKAQQEILADKNYFTINFSNNRRTGQLTLVA